MINYYYYIKLINYFKSVVEWFPNILLFKLKFKRRFGKLKIKKRAMHFIISSLSIKLARYFHKASLHLCVFL